MDFTNFNDALEASKENEIDRFRAASREYFSDVAKAYAIVVYEDILTSCHIGNFGYNYKDPLKCDAYFSCSFAIANAGETHTIDYDRGCRFKVTLDEDSAEFNVSEWHEDGEERYSFFIPVSFLNLDEAGRVAFLEDYKAKKIEAARLEAEAEDAEKTRKAWEKKGKLSKAELAKTLGIG